LWGLWVWEVVNTILSGGEGCYRHILEPAGSPSAFQSFDASNPLPYIVSLPQS